MKFDDLNVANAISPGLALLIFFGDLDGFICNDVGGWRIRCLLNTDTPCPPGGGVPASIPVYSRQVNNRKFTPERLLPPPPDSEREPGLNFAKDWDDLGELEEHTETFALSSFKTLQGVFGGGGEFLLGLVAQIFIFPPC